MTSAEAFNHLREVEQGEAPSSDTSDWEPVQERGALPRVIKVAVAGAVVGMFVLAVAGRSLGQASATHTPIRTRDMIMEAEAVTAAPLAVAQPVSEAAATQVPAAAVAQAGVAAGVVPVAAAAAAQPMGAGQAVPSTVNRAENLADGNKCRDSEELYGTLCYRKCSDLAGPGAIRMNAFSCCTSDCDDVFNIVNWITPSMFPCDGFDVSSAGGKDEGTFACPHGPGACLGDEEQNFGKCYEKCSILTNHEYPYRTAEATCCQKNPAENPLSCIDPFETDTEPSLNVGGGAGDGNKATPSAPHAPLVSQTEAQPASAGES